MGSKAHRWMTFAAVALLSGGLACIDYNVTAEDDDDDTTEDPSDDDTTFYPLDEECNGEDDDGDGLIDEDFPDTDGDGVADCVDDHCDVLLNDPILDVNEDCAGGENLGDPPVNPWNSVIEWRWEGQGVASFAGIYATPTVGDLDLDGLPEVVTTYACPSYFPGCMAVLHGDGTGVIWQIDDIDATGGSALGDIDGDGYGDIVTYRYNGGSRLVVAFDRDGNQMWATPVGAREENYAVIADLDGNGLVEVVANELVIDGQSGNVLATLQPQPSSTWGAPAVADLDGDGFQEIMLENGVYDSSGQLLFYCGSGGVGTFPHPVNVDADPAGEVLIANPSELVVCDNNGAVMWSWPHNAPYGSPVAVADFDGDGLQEFAFAQSGELVLISSAGAPMWITPIQDFSGLAGCTSWDIDLDGIPEVIYADETDILAFHGATGTIVLQEGMHSSVTLAETPSVADVDGDLAGELLYGSNGGGADGLTVIGSGDGDWPYARPVYNQYTYYGANIGNDLSVPSQPLAPWVHPANIFRGQPSAVYQADMPNLQAQITDACVASCEPDGYAALALQIWNDGGAEIEAGSTATVYGGVGGSLVVIDEITLVDPLESGTSIELILETTWEMLGTLQMIIVDEHELIFECIEDDNTGTWEETFCNPVE